MRRHVKCDLLYVHSFRDRYGNWRYYFRRKGQHTPLDGAPGSFEFIRSYKAALEKATATPSTGSVIRGSLDDLRVRYYQSAEYANLAPSTQREMRYAIDALCQMPSHKGGKYGDKAVAMLERKHILALRDKMKDKPGAANKLIRTIKVLLSFAVDRGMRKDNPAHNIKMLKLGTFRDWTDAELAQFEDHWAIGTIERTGYALALFTAQRRSDVAKMRWTDIAGNTIRVKQQKTGTEVVIPIHPELALALQEAPRRGETILTGSSGKPLNPIYFGAIMAEAIEAAGLPDDCVLHGLRKSAARIVEELGGKVGSLTGHLSAQMERQYSQRANQKRNATAAILKWTRKSRTEKQ